MLPRAKVLLQVLIDDKMWMEDIEIPCVKPMA